jgi:hypothetical protein
MCDFYVDDLIIGATFWGVGYAASSKRETFIIEKSIRLGYEYIDCFKFGGDWDCACETKEGETLRNKFIERNIISESHKPILQAYSSMLCDVIVKNNIKILLATRLISVDETAEGYCAVVYNASGITKINAKKVIYTTDLEDNFQKKSVNAMLYKENGVVEHVIREKFELYTGERPDVVYVKVFLDKNDNLIEARKKLYDLLRSKPEELDGCTLVSIGTVFEYYYSDEPQVQSSMSRRYKNPIQSFDMGVLAGNGGIKL